MRSKEHILIRKQAGAIKLSDKTSGSLNKSREKRLDEAFKDNDLLYLNVFFNNISIFQITHLLLKKIESHLKTPYIIKYFQANFHKLR